MNRARGLWVYYILFFSGSLALVYQASGATVFGDSVNFLCILFLIHGFFARKYFQILENSALLTVGYILPLSIRNTIKLSYSEAPSLFSFVKMGIISTLTTFALGCAFSLLGFLLYKALRKFQQISRGSITTRRISED